MKTLREYLMGHMTIRDLKHNKNYIDALFHTYANLTQSGMNKNDAYFKVFCAFDFDCVYKLDGELSQYDNTPKMDVSKIVYQNRYVRIDEQRGTLQNAMDARDAAYLEMREYAGSEDSLYESLCLKFAKAYCEWKDEIEKLRRMVAE